MPDRLLGRRCGAWIRLSCLLGGFEASGRHLPAAVLLQLLPALLDDWGAPPDLLTVIFGVGVLQVLATAPEGLVVQVPRDLTNLGRLLLRLGRKAVPR